MVFRFTRVGLFLTVILTLFIAGCTLPASSPTQSVPPYTPEPGATYTSAVQTVIAQQTEIAGAVGTGAPVPSETTETELVVTSTSMSEPTSTAAPESTGTTAATATAQPSATSQPPSTAQPTATVPASDPALGLGTPDFREPFDNDTNWGFTTDEHTSMVVEDGQLEMTAFKPENWDGWTITWVNGENFYLEMTAQPQTCSGLDRYGMIFRASIDASEGYLFGLSCDGKYSLRTWDGEKFDRLIDWTANPAIQTGASNTNRLGVKTEGTSISLYANGILLQEIEDDTFSEGHFGVFVGSANTENFKVLVDQILWWGLD